MKRGKKGYNRLYVWRFLCMQITMLRGYEVIPLLPQLTLAINGEYLLFGIGLDWLMGGINFGLMNRYFRNKENLRQENLRTYANKLGVLPRVWEQRYGD